MPPKYRRAPWWVATWGFRPIQRGRFVNNSFSSPSGKSWPNQTESASVGVLFVACFPDKKIADDDQVMKYTSAEGALKRNVVILTKICRWLHQKLSLWQLPVLAVTKISSKWEFCFIVHHNAQHMLHITKWRLYLCQWTIGATQKDRYLIDVNRRTSHCYSGALPGRHPARLTGRTGINQRTPNGHGPPTRTYGTAAMYAITIKECR